MVYPHTNLVMQWRKRALHSQTEARRVLAEMLTPSGGARSNCYKFINWVTGCSFNTICKVRDQMRRTKGEREPPQHGLYSYWQQKMGSKRNRKQTSAAATDSRDSIAREAFRNDSNSFEQPSGTTDRSHAGMQNQSPKTGIEEHLVQLQDNLMQKSVCADQQQIPQPQLTEQANVQQMGWVQNSSNLETLQSQMMQQLSQVQSVQQHLTATIYTLQQQMAALQPDSYLPYLQMNPQMVAGALLNQQRPSLTVAHQNPQAVTTLPTTQLPMPQSNLTLNQMAHNVSNPQVGATMLQSNLAPVLQSNVPLVVVQQNTQLNALQSNQNMGTYVSNQHMTALQSGQQFPLLQSNHQAVYTWQSNKQQSPTVQPNLLPMLQVNQEISDTQISQHIVETHGQQLGLNQFSNATAQQPTVHQFPMYQQQQQSQQQPSLHQLTQASLQSTLQFPVPTTSHFKEPSCPQSHSLPALSFVDHQQQQLPFSLPVGQKQNIGLLPVQQLLTHNGLTTAPPHVLQNNLTQQGASFQLVHQIPGMSQQESYMQPLYSQQIQPQQTAIRLIEQQSQPAQQISSSLPQLPPSSALLPTSTLTVQSLSSSLGTMQQPLLVQPASSGLTLTQSAAAQNVHSLFPAHGFAANNQQVAFAAGHEESSRLASVVFVTVTTVSSMTTVSAVNSKSKAETSVGSIHSGLQPASISSSQDMLAAQSFNGNMGGYGHYSGVGQSQNLMKNQMLQQEQYRQNPHMFLQTSNQEHVPQPPPYCNAAQVVQSNSSVQHSSSVVLQNPLLQVNNTQQVQESEGHQLGVEQQNSTMRQFQIQNLTSGIVQQHTSQQPLQMRSQPVNVTLMHSGDQIVDQSGQQKVQANTFYTDSVNAVTAQSFLHHTRFLQSQQKLLPLQGHVPSQAVQSEGEVQRPSYSMTALQDLPFSQSVSISASQAGHIDSCHSMQLPDSNIHTEQRTHQPLNTDYSDQLLFRPPPYELSNGKLCTVQPDTENKVQALNTTKITVLSSGQVVEKPVVTEEGIVQISTDRNEQTLPEPTASIGHGYFLTHMHTGGDQSRPNKVVVSQVPLSKARLVTSTPIAVMSHIAPLSTARIINLPVPTRPATLPSANVLSAPVKESNRSTTVVSYSRNPVSTSAAVTQGDSMLRIMLSSKETPVCVTPTSSSFTFIPRLQVSSSTVDTAQSIPASAAQLQLVTIANHSPMGDMTRYARSNAASRVFVCNTSGQQVSTVTAPKSFGLADSAIAVQSGCSSEMNKQKSKPKAGKAIVKKGRKQSTEYGSSTKRKRTVVQSQKVQVVCFGVNDTSNSGQAYAFQLQAKEASCAVKPMCSSHVTQPVSTLFSPSFISRPVDMNISNNTPLSSNRSIPTPSSNTEQFNPVITTVPASSISSTIPQILISTQGTVTPQLSPVLSAQQPQSDSACQSTHLILTGTGGSVLGRSAPFVMQQPGILSRLLNSQSTGAQSAAVSTNVSREAVLTAKSSCIIGNPCVTLADTKIQTTTSRTGSQSSSSDANVHVPMTFLLPFSLAFSAASSANSTTVSSAQQTLQIVSGSKTVPVSQVSPTLLYQNDSSATMSPQTAKKRLKIKYISQDNKNSDCAMTKVLKTVDTHAKLSIASSKAGVGALVPVSVVNPTLSPAVSKLSAVPASDAKKEITHSFTSVRNILLPAQVSNVAISDANFFKPISSLLTGTTSKDAVVATQMTKLANVTALSGLSAPKMLLLGSGPALLLAGLPVQADHQTGSNIETSSSVSTTTKAMAGVSNVIACSELQPASASQSDVIQMSSNATPLVPVSNPPIVGSGTVGPVSVTLIPSSVTSSAGTYQRSHNPVLNPNLAVGTEIALNKDKFRDSSQTGGETFFVLPNNGSPVGTATKDVSLTKELTSVSSSKWKPGKVPVVPFQSSGYVSSTTSSSSMPTGARPLFIVSCASLLAAGVVVPALAAASTSSSSLPVSLALSFPSSVAPDPVVPAPVVAATSSLMSQTFTSSPPQKTSSVQSSSHRLQLIPMVRSPYHVPIKKNLKVIDLIRMRDAKAAAVSGPRERQSCSLTPQFQDLPVGVVSSSDHGGQLLLENHQTPSKADSYVSVSGCSKVTSVTTNVTQANSSQTAAVISVDCVSLSTSLPGPTIATSQLSRSSVVPISVDQCIDPE